MILVTGSTGLLGNNTVRRLLDRGHRVRVLVRRNAICRELEGLQVDAIEGDFGDRKTAERAVDGCLAVIHCAAMIHIGWTKLEEARRVNVLATETLAHAARDARCRFLHVSTVDTLCAAKSIDEPIDESSIGQSHGVRKLPCTYVASKSESERAVVALLDQGLDAQVFHPGLMFGPYDWKPSSGQMMLGLLRMPVIVAPRGSGSICDARDVADALCNAIERGKRGEHYILAGENLSYVDLWRRMLPVVGSRKRVFQMGPVIPFIVKGLDRFHQMTGRPEGLVNSASLGMGMLHHCYDSSKAERELGYSRRSLETTLADAWDWLKKVHVASRPAE